ncbi:MAG: histidinol phosphate phosphatase domain-containing protein [Candidatus Endomicrobiellum trichonymphae]|uniref:histidinol phosphate phosphatase domain-containing protein n=1 Tax=Endomicrobium trichonymphae TaxID=1408204 RepID=UPI0027D3C225|nr:MAG: histidinol phosphate phosphatase domain-containing protein [Candidatus Endomicrobium trichonymphae]
MIDLHTHTFFSDGVLSPSELVYRAKYKGYTAIALTDHIDCSNMKTVIAGITKVAKILTENYDILVLTGAELTYIPPKLIKDSAAKCRKLGAEIIIVHGETVAETVPPKTNIYAVEAGVDILAHPGHLSEEEAGIAAENNVKIEITSRKGHNVTNKEVAEVALKKKAKLVLNTDTHSPENLLSKELIAKVLSDAGLSSNYYDIMQKNSLEIIESKRIQ